MAEEQAPPSGKKLNGALLMQIIVAVINLTFVGGGVYMTYISTIAWHSPEITEAQLQAEAEAEKTQEKEPLAPLVYTMDKFTVNLDGEPKRTIRVEVNLEMLNKDGFEEVIDYDNRAKARDKIVQLLNNKSYAELESIQGKLFLKDQIATEMNAILDKGVVKDIYFSEFVVQ